MRTKILKTEKDYNDACERIYILIHSNENAIEPASSEGEEIELLSLLIEKYEQEHFSIQAPSPIEAIRFRMDQMNLKQADLAPLFGGKTRISEVLNGKRPLTLKMITLLNRYLGIPLESLVNGNKDIKLDPEKREKILSIDSIKDYFTKSGRVAVL
ncbi:MULTISPECIES: type II toxin-antitoxin system HigA family antitoxin [unclassified Lentimicrobium]|uniref:helix-turn-helix domain-containing protein n=1 Tax=unclassified Lentimicrobium TaxID=2677434 RepID=UPI001554382A|nr:MULTISPECIES: helix-turn-helix domain-containing protein [unclassified Lentimicrobium]NPD44501.1 helix-turn-helix domain-containing protein [Lentimicrobium sp. S6]NPD84199.1 helix-turn-helix domain-containing protein [Lentimicrobium sp. L6]